MARQLEYQELKDALDEGVNSLHKWYGCVDSTSPGYFICLGMFFNLSFLGSVTDTVFYRL